MLTINHVYFSYQGNAPYILNDMNLSVQKGDYISIVGDNGCGKSTLLRLILGFLTPVKGSISATTKNIRYVSQKNDFAHAGFPITVQEILDSYRKLLHIKDTGEVDRVLELTNMTEFKQRLIGKLSGGQAQRISIARALIGKPDLIILDEPSTGIDRTSQQDMYALLKKLNTDHHIAILSVEHNLEMALANSTQIYHISGGHGHLCSPEQYVNEIMHTKGGHHDCSCFTDVDNRFTSTFTSSTTSTFTSSATSTFTSSATSTGASISRDSKFGGTNAANSTTTENNVNQTIASKEDGHV